MQTLTLAFSPDGAHLASAGVDRKVRIWDAATLDQVATFAGHEGHIGWVDWDATGHRLASCSGDFTVRIWEPDPIRTRVQAREARRQALTEVEPMVAALFEQFKDASKVIEQINANLSLSPLARKTALQVVLRKGLESQAASGTNPIGRATEPR